MKICFSSVPNSIENVLNGALGDEILRVGGDRQFQPGDVAEGRNTSRDRLKTQRRILVIEPIERLRGEFFELFDDFLEIAVRIFASASSVEENGDQRGT